MPARFKVLNVFQIAGRGRVVAGEILEGVVRVGMLALPEDSARDPKWFISGVEFADNVSGRESHVALLLQDAPQLDDLRARLPPGSVLEIKDAASS